MAVGERQSPTDDQSGTDLTEPLHDGFQDLDVSVSRLSAPYRAYVRTTPQYIPGRGVARYRSALKNLIPIRKNKPGKEVIGVDRAGFVSYITFSWLSKYMFKAYRTGLTQDDLPQGSPLDSCDFNSQRLELLWQQEIVKKGPKRASFKNAVWKFVRTRILISCLIFTTSLVFGFISPTIFMRKLLEYAENPDGETSEGILWAVCLVLAEFMRTLFFAWNWAINYRTAVRLRSACLALLYRKIIRLNKLGDNSIGQLINMFAIDSQRIFDMILFGPMIIGGPLVTIAGMFYIYWLLGWWALLGMTTFVIFYPTQYGISRLIGYLRGKTLFVTDERVRLMAEILNCIKLIKMYAWEKSFSKALQGARKRERRLLQWTAYCQSLSLSMAPTIPVISAIVTFLAHVGAGNTLTASQAFSVWTYFSKLAALSLLLVNECCQRLWDGIIAVRRLQAFSILTFLTKQARTALNLLQETYISMHEGLITMKRVQAFSLVPIFNNQIRNSFNVMRVAMANILDGRIAFKRLKTILVMEDLRPYIARPIDKSQAIVITNATFAWGNNSQSSAGNVIPEKESLKPDGSSQVNVLFDIDVAIPKGRLIGICGVVGSGKTSLLLAAIGQLRLLKGQVTRDGSCAYVSQEAWILNATLRDNILFGETFDSKRYYDAVYSCCLGDDINVLPGGDRTEIGERGINLSGGQKQRVSLARALYANRDIYLLDDPLSAVDTHVGAHIFEKCILTALRNKTVLFVTHQVQLLNRCDEVLVMKDGHMAEKGTHEELMATDTEYAAMINARIAEANRYSGGQEPEEGVVAGDHIPSEPGSTENLPSSNQHLTEAENTGQGSISPNTYISYILAAGGFWIALIVCISILLNVGSTAFSSWWLAHWISAGSGNTTIIVNNATVVSNNLNDNPEFDKFRLVYSCTIGAILITSFLRGFVFTKATLYASGRMHERLFDSILHGSMSFFNTTPAGRVHNLFSRDMDEVDTRLPISVESILQNIWMVFFAVLFVCLVFPWFIVPLFVLASMYYIISKIFRVAVRDLKRLENVSRSPIFSFVSTTVQGLSTIHAFGKETEFIAKFTQMFDENSTCLYLCCVAMRWLAVRLDTLAVSLIAVTSTLIIILHGEVSPALAGLALAYSAHISGMFQYTVRLVSETEVRFISVERINSYLQNIRREGDIGRQTKPASDWPMKGHIQFDNVSLCYRNNQPIVLKNVSFSVSAGEKIGIVGRTGSGKSSLVVALFRLVELSSGRILIDGQDISEITLKSLRRRLSVIPQDPVLFEGTIRSNLDPFGLRSDEELWTALDKTKLRQRISSVPGQLNSVAGNNGESFSVGERQLLCLARALLRDSKILVLDEATSGVDPETETAVQSTIAQEFTSCTVLTIAHRLATITSCDRILVLARGRILEYDSPANLLANSNSEFYKMMAAADATMQGPDRLS